MEHVGRGGGGERLNGSDRDSAEKGGRADCLTATTKLHMPYYLRQRNGVIE